MRTWNSQLAKIMRPREKNVSTNTRNSAFLRALSLSSYTQILLYRGISFIAAFAYHMNFRVQRHLPIVYIQHIGG